MDSRSEDVDDIATATLLHEGIAHGTHAKTPKRLVSRMARKSSADISSTDWKMPMQALLTRMSTPPYEVRAKVNSLYLLVIANITEQCRLRPSSSHPVHWRLVQLPPRASADANVLRHCAPERQRCPDRFPGTAGNDCCLSLEVHLNLLNWDRGRPPR